MEGKADTDTRMKGKGEGNMLTVPKKPDMHTVPEKRQQLTRMVDRYTGMKPLLVNRKQHTRVQKQHLVLCMPEKKQSRDIWHKPPDQ